MNKRGFLAVILVIGIMVGVGVLATVLPGILEGAPTAANVSERRLVNAASEPDQWLTHGGTYAEQRFSPLNQINTENIDQLGLAWYADFDTNRGQESTPLVVDGVLYVSTAWSKVKAYDARTGAVIWEYDPKVPGEWGAKACCDVVNRGVAVWDGKVYVGTLDGRLVAIDAETGEEVWQTNTIDRDRSYSITGAPRVVKGKVLIGNGGAEYGVRGYVSAYDAETGDLDWRFYTVPGNPADGFENAAMEMAVETWDGEWWAVGGGGGTVWDAIVYDPQTDLVYIGTGNGSPWNSQIRSPGDGDNLFLTSIVALDPDNGEYVWHYQTVQRETWDYTATQPIMVADLEIDGQMRHVVMQAPKNGFFYVIDAADGELISAEPFVNVTWATGVDMETGRPIENPAARFEVTGVPAVVLPHAGGGHSWHPWSYSPITGLVYIPAMEANQAYSVATGEYVYTEGTTNTGVGFGGGANSPYDQPDAPEAQSDGMLLAWNPVTQEEAWRVPFGERGRGGGTLATAGGIVFQGNSRYQEFAAYDAATGEKLWSMPAQTGIVAGPVTYDIVGEQYVAVSAGNNQNNYYASNHSRILVFKLGGEAELPPPEPPSPPPPIDPPPATASQEIVDRGEAEYTRVCSQCHGGGARAGGNFPDLRRSRLIDTPELFASVVLDGDRALNGMGSFEGKITPEDTEAVRAFIIDRAHAAQSAPAGRGDGRGGPPGGPPGGRGGPPPTTAAPEFEPPA
jgi:quinohemoprotein ethanol dehydrogenase